jgi:hypothetical protein
MPEFVVERAVDGHAFRHQDDGPTAGRERRAYIAKGGFVVTDMFQNVEADHGVEPLLKRLEIPGLLEIAFAGLNVRPSLKTCAQATQVLGADIAGDITLTSAREQRSQVADAGADFEHMLADVGRHSACHPRIETRRS